MSIRISELAKRLGARLENASVDSMVDALAMADVAADNEVSFVPGVRALISDTAGAVLVSVAQGQRNALVVDNVLLACARSSEWLRIRRNGEPRTRRTSVLAESARIASGAYLGTGVHVGDNTVIAHGVVLGDGVTIGAHCRIETGTVVCGEATIGNRVCIGAASSVGSEGFAFLHDGPAWCAMPAFGSVSIADDVTIRAHVVIHAGVLGDTVIAQGCILDSQVLIGHDSRVGPYSAIAGQTAIAGAACIGRHCRIGGKVGVGEGVQIADRVTVTAMSMVTRSITDAGARYSSGWPAEPSRTWWRRVAQFRRPR